MSRELKFGSDRTLIAAGGEAIKAPLLKYGGAWNLDDDQVPGDVSMPKSEPGDLLFASLGAHSSYNPYIMNWDNLTDPGDNEGIFYKACEEESESFRVAGSPYARQNGIRAVISGLKPLSPAQKAAATDWVENKTSPNLSESDGLLALSRHSYSSSSGTYSNHLVRVGGGDNLQYSFIGSLGHLYSSQYLYPAVSFIPKDQPFSDDIPDTGYAIYTNSVSLIIPVTLA